MKMMNKQFLKYETILELKKIGFNEPCLGYYIHSNKHFGYNTKPTITNDSFTLDAPTYQEVVDWFRTKFDIHISNPILKIKDKGRFYGGFVKHGTSDFGKSYGSNFIEYYDAYEHAIKIAIKMYNKKYELQDTI